MGAALVLLFSVLVALISAETQTPGEHSAWLGAETPSNTSDVATTTPRRPQKDGREV